MQTKSGVMCHQSTYSDSEASKFFIDALIADIPRWYCAAELLGQFPLETNYEHDV